MILSKISDIFQVTTVVLTPAVRSSTYVRLTSVNTVPGACLLSAVVSAVRSAPWWTCLRDTSARIVGILNIVMSSVDYGRVASQGDPS